MCRTARPAPCDLSHLVTARSSALPYNRPFLTKWAIRQTHRCRISYLPLLPAIEGSLLPRWVRKQPHGTRKFDHKQSPHSSFPRRRESRGAGRHGERHGAPRVDPTYRNSTDLPLVIPAEAGTKRGCGAWQIGRPIQWWSMCQIAPGPQFVIPAKGDL